MISQNPYSENPTGPESPSWEFPFSRGQVVLGLLLIAAGLTLWKQYELRFVAPATVVRWEDPSAGQLDTMLRNRRSLLVWLVPDDPDQARRQARILATPDVQRAVYYRKPWAVRIPVNALRPQMLPVEVPDFRTRGGALMRIDVGRPPRLRMLGGQQIEVAAVVQLVDSEPDQGTADADRDRGR